MKVKSPAKDFTSDVQTIEEIVVRTMDKISQIVGSSLGPGGKNVIIESDLPGIPNKNTKDGVTIFKSLGSKNAYEHLIIEQTRDVAIRTVNEAGDGPQPLWANVLTPKGFVPMSDVRVGMEICGTDGTIQKVLEVYPKGSKEIVEVAFSDGKVVECCKDHLWTVQDSDGKFKTLTTLAISEDYKTITNNGEILYRYRTPATFVKYNDGNKHPIHSYVVTDIRPTGKHTEMQCIKVSNPDSLYITDNFVVTHNTTSATVISAALIKNLLTFCKENRKYSPQKVVREINKFLNDFMIPYIDDKSIKVDNKNKKLLEQVATISANGDVDMAKAVIQAFEEVGYGASSHVTIQELSGPSGYEVELIEGFPINKGYEESIGKFHSAFINDQGNLRCLLDSPLFLLFDGKVNDIVQVASVLQDIGDRYVNGDANFCNVVIVAHGYSEQVLTNLALNFQNPNTINIVPLSTPVNQIVNSQTNFLMDLSAFTGAKIFDMNESILDANVENDLGQNMNRLEMYRFRTTVVGDPDETNIEVRAEEIEGQMKQSESKIEKALLEERLGKLTSGIARLKIYGASNGELKEKADRAEDAVCSVRAAINHGCLPGGGRILLNLAFELAEKHIDNPIIQDIIAPSLMNPFYKLLENAGYNEEEIVEVLSKMEKDRKKIFNVAEGEMGTEKKMGVYDATLAVKQALSNAVSIAGVMGTLGGIVAEPRSYEVEKENALQEMDFQRNIDNAGSLKNEANERG